MIPEFLKLDPSKRLGHEITRLLVRRAVDELNDSFLYRITNEVPTAVNVLGFGVAGVGVAGGAVCHSLCPRGGCVPLELP